MFDLLTRIFLVGSLIVYVPNRLDGDENFALAAMMILSACAFQTERLRKPDYRALIAPFVFAASMVFFSKCVASMSSVLNVFVALCAVKAIAERTDMNQKTLSNALLVFFGITYAVMIAQYAGLDFMVSVFDGEKVGMSFRPWILGCQAALAVPFLARRHAALAVVALPALYFSHSTACIIAGLLGWALVVRWEWALLGSFIGAPVILINFLVRDNFDMNRIIVWKRAMGFCEHILFGMGLGSWAHSGFARKHGTDWMHWRWAHNEFYQQLFEQGMIGLTLAVMALAVILWMAKTRATRAAVIVLAVLSMAHPVLHWGKLTFFAVLIVGLALAEHANERGEICRL